MIYLCKTNQVTLKYIHSSFYANTTIDKLKLLKGLRKVKVSNVHVVRFSIDDWWYTTLNSNCKTTPRWMQIRLWFVNSTDKFIIEKIYQTLYTPKYNYRCVGSGIIPCLLAKSVWLAVRWIIKNNKWRWAVTWGWINSQICTSGRLKLQTVQHFH